MQFSSSPPAGGWCQEYWDHFRIEDCQDQVNRIDTTREVIWFVLAAWDEEKEWCGTEFGLGEYDPGVFLITDYGPCWPEDGLEIPTASWPGPGEGTAIVATGTPWEGNFVPVHWLAGYAYESEPGLIPLAADPATDFVGTSNCANPPEAWAADSLGAMGLFQDGAYACPEGLMAAGQCSGHQTQNAAACCIGDHCFTTIEEDCEALRGEFHSEYPSCNPSPCGEPEPLGRRILTVCPEGGQYATIQAAIDSAQNGDIIELCCDAPFSGNGNRDIVVPDIAITIRSECDDPERCIINLGGTLEDPHKGFSFLESEGPTDALCLKGMTIEHAYFCRTTGSGGGVLCRPGSSPAIENCRFVDNVGGQNSSGGAIGTQGRSSPFIVDCVFEGNAVEKHGGAIFLNVAENSSPIVMGCRFSGNSALLDGGALAACYGDCTSRLWVLACTFTYDAAGGGGGAMKFHAVDDSSASEQAVSLCTLSENSADTGGGVLCGSHARVTVDNTIIVSGSLGDAVACGDTASAALTCCDVWGNEGGDWVGCIENQYPGNGNFHDDPVFCGDENPPYPSTLDYSSPLVSDSSSTCGQIGAWWAGCGGTSEVQAYAAIPPTWVLAPPQPNPFTRETRLVLDVPRGAGLSIHVYDSSGRRIRVLARDARADGSRVVFWDGTDDRGLLQHSGIYFVRVQAGGVSRERSLLLLR